jgi:hypothetical protein
MDEQECVQSDVALACFVRAALRGLIASNAELLPTENLIKDFNAIITQGLDAKVSNPNGKTARQVCQNYLRLANENGTEDEKKYLWLVKRRIDSCLSELIRAKFLGCGKNRFHQAIMMFIQRLVNAYDNQPIHRCLMPEK